MQNTMEDDAKTALSLTAIEYLEPRRQVLVAQTDRTLSFYSPILSHKSVASDSYRPEKNYTLPSVVSCISKAHEFHTDNDIIVLGDVAGYCSAVDCSTNSLRHRAQVQSEECVKRIRFLPKIGLATTGLDHNISIVDTTKWNVVNVLRGHRRGVFGMDYCPNNHMLISISFDGRLLAWDPYVSAPVSRVKGFHPTVIDIFCNEDSNQIISVCSDKRIKIYDIRTWTCIQTLVDADVHRPKDNITAAALDTKRQVLITGGSHIKLWPVVNSEGIRLSDERSREQRAHTSLIVSVMYSHLFKLVVSVSVDQRVHTWDVLTGQRVFQFKTDHEGIILTAAIDSRGQRLLTSSICRQIKCWNFHNGEVRMIITETLSNHRHTDTINQIE